jgi:hypothetical protein
VGFFSASAERRMPRREGEVFRLGTAMSYPLGVSRYGIVPTIQDGSSQSQRARMPIKAALIEEGMPQS